MKHILKFDWDDTKALKVNLEEWACNADVLLMEQDEELLFHCISWTQIVFPFMFKKECVKRERMIITFLEFIRESFLHRKTNEIRQIETLFIKEMRAHHAKTADKAIGDCVSYFTSCKQVFENPLPTSPEQAKKIGQLLLNDLTNTAKLTTPIVTENNNYQIVSTSSVRRYICIDKKTGHYKYNGYKPCQ